MLENPDRPDSTAERARVHRAHATDNLNDAIQRGKAGDVAGAGISNSAAAVHNAIAGAAEEEAGIVPHGAMLDTTSNKIMHPGGEPVMDLTSRDQNVEPPATPDE